MTIVPNTNNVMSAYVFAESDVMGYTDDTHTEELESQFKHWKLGEDMRAINIALEKVVELLKFSDDGGKIGVAAHSKSSAAALAHRNAVLIVQNYANMFLTTKEEDND